MSNHANVECTTMVLTLGYCRSQIVVCASTTSRSQIAVESKQPYSGVILRWPTNGAIPLAVGQKLIFC